MGKKRVWNGDNAAVVAAMLIAVGYLEREGKYEEREKVGPLSITSSFGRCRHTETGAEGCLY